MQFTLLTIPKEHLHALADSIVPPTLIYTCAEGALPPPFVASRCLEYMETAASPHWCTTFYVLDKNKNHIVGGCGFKSPPHAGRVEIGYGIAPECRQQGAATAAVQTLLKLAFDGGVGEVLAEVLPDNIASIRVVQKAGFVQIGSRIDEAGDFVVQWLVNKTN